MKSVALQRQPYLRKGLRLKAEKPKGIAGEEKTGETQTQFALEWKGAG
jgi:hypothetical protein